MAADEVWTVRRILDWTVGFLERKGDERPRLSAEWLLCHVTGLSRVELYVNFERPLSAEELAAMHDAVARRGRGEPLQYVTGEMPFRHIILRCEEGVLIPRPETEVLVDAALEGVDAAVAGITIMPTSITAVRMKLMILFFMIPAEKSCFFPSPGTPDRFRRTRTLLIK